jgi:hypothetical protein
VPGGTAHLARHRRGARTAVGWLQTGEAASDRASVRSGRRAREARRQRVQRGSVERAVGEGEVRAGRATQEKVVLRSPLKVAQDALHSRQVGLHGVVHMQTNLLHGVCDVGSGERQVLKSTGDTPKLGSVLTGGPESAASFAWMLTGVVHGLQSAMAAR